MTESSGLRKIIPVWKPTPSKHVQRYCLSDNGSMGVTVSEVSSEGTVEFHCAKQNCSTRFVPVFFSPLPLLPPNPDAYSPEEVDARKTRTEKWPLKHLESLRFKRALRKHTLTFKSDPSKLEELQRLYHELESGYNNVQLNLPANLVNIVQRFPDEFSKVLNDSALYNRGGIQFVDGLSLHNLHKGILYISGNRLNHLVYAPVEFDNLLEPQCRSLQFHNCSSKTFTKKIYHVSSTKIDDQFIYGVRMARRLEFGKIVECDNNVVFNTMAQMTPGKRILDLSLCSYTFEYLYALNDHFIGIVDLETGQVINQCTDFVNTEPKGKCWISCQFALHPRCYLCTIPKVCMMIDRRVTSSRCLKLLRSPSEAVILGERFTCYEKSKANAHLHYIGSTHSLFLLDDRYPMHPVLSWKHQLVDIPNYCSASLWCHNDNYTAEEGVILVAKETQESVAFHIKHSDLGQQLSLSHSPPLHICPPKDFVIRLRQAGRLVDAHAQTELPLHGFCCFTPKDKLLVALYLTSDGNVFHQVFGYAGSDEWHLDENWQPPLTKEQADYALNWLEIATKARSVVKLAHDIDGVDLSNLYKEITKNGSHARNCLSCCKCTKPKICKLNKGPICRRCTLPVAYTKYLHDKINKSGVVAGDVPRLENGSLQPNLNSELYTLTKPTMNDDGYEVLKSITDIWFGDNPEHLENDATQFPQVVLNEDGTPTSRLSQNNDSFAHKVEDPLEPWQSASFSMDFTSQNTVHNNLSRISVESDSTRTTSQNCENADALLDNVFQSTPNSVRDCKVSALGVFFDSEKPSSSFPVAMHASRHSDAFSRLRNNQLIDVACTSQGFYYPDQNSQDSNAFALGGTPRMNSWYESENIVPPSQLTTFQPHYMGSVRKAKSDRALSRPLRHSVDGF